MGNETYFFIFTGPILHLNMCPSVINPVTLMLTFPDRITTDPVELWTSEDSVSRMQKIDYDSQFGTTYRTCQVKEIYPCV